MKCLRTANYKLVCFIFLTSLASEKIHLKNIFKEYSFSYPPNQQAIAKAKKGHIFCKLSSMSTVICISGCSEDNSCWTEWSFFWMFPAGLANPWFPGKWNATHLSFLSQDAILHSRSKSLQWYFLLSNAHGTMLPISQYVISQLFLNWYMWSTTSVKYIQSAILN